MVLQFIHSTTKIQNSDMTIMSKALNTICKVNGLYDAQ